MTNKPFERSNRVSIEIKKTISNILNSDLNDPRLKNTTITEVEISKDLKIAKIYFTTHNIYGKKEKKNTINGFSSAKGYLKRKIAKCLNLRYTPDIKFYYDNSFDYGSQIDRILKNISND